MIKEWLALEFLTEFLQTSEKQARSLVVLSRFPVVGVQTIGFLKIGAPPVIRRRLINPLLEANWISESYSRKNGKSGPPSYKWSVKEERRDELISAITSANKLAEKRFFDANKHLSKLL